MICTAIQDVQFRRTGFSARNKTLYEQVCRAIPKRPDDIPAYERRLLADIAGITDRDPRAELGILLYTHAVCLYRLARFDDLLNRSRDFMQLCKEATPQNYLPMAVFVHPVYDFSRDITRRPISSGKNQILGSIVNMLTGVLAIQLLVSKDPRTRRRGPTIQDMGSDKSILVTTLMILAIAKQIEQ